MESKINNIRRFFTLLFTDKDITEENVSENTQHVDDFFMPEWPNEITELNPITEAEPIIRIEAENIGPEKEEIMTHVIEEATVPEPLFPALLALEEQKQEKTILPIEKKSTYEQIILGITPDGNESVGVDITALKRHMLVVGMTGSGKTTMLERMILQDIDAGRGVGLIDPHGDLYDKILRQIPKSRSNDVVLFDLTDVEYPIGFNILENTHHQFPSLIASSIVGVFKKIFGYSWGPRLEYILRNATLTLLERDGSTLLDLAMLLSDESFRRDYLSKVKNPFLQKFWSDEFENLSASKQAEVVSPILNKVGQFLSVPLIRNIISQPQSGFSPRWIMDNKKIFLANLSKGKIGEDVSEMLGSMLVSKFQLDVMSRANIAPEERQQYSLYVDEFQNFATESFADIFSEARKYGLGLVIAHQYVGQVSNTLMDAILGNVGNMALFHVGSNDAKLFAPNFSSQTTPAQLTEQPLYAFTLKTSRDGQKKIIQGELIPPGFIGPRSGIQNPEKLQALVRDKFAKKREFVEGKLDQKFFS